MRVNQRFKIHFIIFKQMSAILTVTNFDLEIKITPFPFKFWNTPLTKPSYTHKGCLYTVQCTYWFFLQMRKTFFIYTIKNCLKKHFPWVKGDHFQSRIFGVGCPFQFSFTYIRKNFRICILCCPLFNKIYKPYID